MDERRDDARNKKEKNGQPKIGFIFGDAMTSTKGDTIKDGLGLSSNHNDASIMNRVFAFEVVCGEIEFMMYISHDQTIDKGANLAGKSFLI